MDQTRALVSGVLCLLGLTCLPIGVALHLGPAQGLETFGALALALGLVNSLARGAR